jgi:phage terminase large subunit
MQRRLNSNLVQIFKAYRNGKRGIILEGSSRSGKTYSTMDFLFYIYSHTKRPTVTNIIKETYNSFKTTLYDDFSNRINSLALPNPFDRSKEVSTFKLWNHKINFLGADNPSKFHGAGCDFLWLNEMLDIDRPIFDNAEMRCRKFWIGDYNPSVSIHYVYDNVIPRDSVSFYKSTFRENPYISRPELQKILSYQPTPENIRQGTADDYMWAVYGKGERMSRTGIVYRNVTWVDSFPTDYDRVGYAMDLGFTNSPSSLSKVTTEGNNLFAECLFYEPTETPEEMAVLLNGLGLADQHIWCDSAHPVFIAKLNSLGFKIFAIRKTPIMDGIALVKKWKLHFVRNRHVQKEQENYSMREVNGIPIDEPIKKHDHFMDSLRYNVMANFRL